MGPLGWSGQMQQSCPLKHVHPPYSLGLPAVRWVLDWLKQDPVYKNSYTPEMLNEDSLKRVQLARLSRQLGRRRPPLPDLQQLIDDGRALAAGE